MRFLFEERLDMSFHYKYNRTLLTYSQTNKKEQTDAEKRLWFQLRDRRLNGYKFRRQYPILNYILDFYCVEKKLAIELDGGRHTQKKLYDEKRTHGLQQLEIQVVRFWDNEVLQNTENVLEKILHVLKEISIDKPHPALS